MRLQEFELQAIRDSFNSVFQEGKIYLFGSRVDDNIKGGDIDLFIDTSSTGNMKEKKIEFLVDLKSKIGDQKIDVVISKDKNRIIEREAIQKGIIL